MDDDPNATVWQIERGFWTGDDAFYEANLTEDALVAFAAPVGLLGKAQAVEWVQRGPRFERVELDDCRALLMCDRALLLAYRVCGWPAGGGAPYCARVVSNYVKRRGRWMLAFHQHTPVGAVGDEGASAARRAA